MPNDILTLEAIGTLLDAKLDAKLAPINDRLARLEIASNLQRLADRVASVEQTVQRLQEER